MPMAVTMIFGISALVLIRSFIDLCPRFTAEPADPMKIWLSLRSQRLCGEIGGRDQSSRAKPILSVTCHWAVLPS